LVVVSNRVAVPKAGAPPPGGLAVGIRAALKGTEGVWFGWGGSLADSEPGPATITRSSGVTYATIDIEAADFEGFYEGFSNSILWPLFHYQLGHFRYRRKHYAAYCKVNDLFARRLLPILQPDDMIWIHDYQLIPLAQSLRRLGATQPIGLFLHIPFPAYDMLRVLPVARQLFQALCAYDLVGFQTHTDQDAFLENAEHGMGAVAGDDGSIQLDGRTLRTGVFPIGIDVEDTIREAQMGQGLKAAHRLTASLQGRLLMIGADRLDYSKGLLERLRAYGRLLEHHKELLNEVIFLQIAQPSRTGIASYQQISQQLQRILGRINATFTAFDWVPLRYMEKSIGRKTLMGFFRIGRVGIVTPLRDGMNLVAKEFAAAQDEDDPGVLVLSSLSGAAHELRSALIVNPYDHDAVADAMNVALSMPLAERRDRHQAMLEILRRNDIHAWRRNFIDALLATRATSRAAGESPTASTA
jgi:trehalose 6-phosphate synthase